MKNREMYKTNREIKSKKGQDTFINVNTELTKDLFIDNKEILEASVYVHRIFANLMLTLKNDQFHKDNGNYQMKLNLFEDEFMSEDNQAILIRMNSYDVCKGANYDYLKGALEFLESYKKQWYSCENQQGQKIKYYGGLISNPVINTDTGGFQFFVTGFWLKKILELTKYNRTFYKLILNLRSNKQILFFYWLSTLPEDGTKIHYDKLNERYGLAYSSARELIKGFLKPIKKNLDKYSHISFNYSYNGDIINVIKYNQTAENFSILNNASEKTFEDLKKRYSIAYVARRHQLSELQKEKIKGLIKYEHSAFIEAYKLFISTCRRNKMKATDIIAEDFIDKLNKCLKMNYSQTEIGKRRPNAYPRI